MTNKDLKQAANNVIESCYTKPFMQRLGDIAKLTTAIRKHKESQNETRN